LKKKREKAFLNKNHSNGIGLPANILVVDDDENILEVLKLRLESNGYNVFAAVNSNSALNMAKNTLFDLALVDLKIGDENGVELMQELHVIIPDMPVLILTAYGTIKTAVEAMQQGAFGYITKPFNSRELLLQIKNGLDKSILSREVRRLKILLGERYGFKNIIGKSKKMQESLDQVARAAETDSNVCIYGESGTGKELIAKSIHLLSSRKDKSLITINCASIPDGLFEGELFGYEKGAFTGAFKKKRGFFSQADKGSILLDEISELPEAMQAKLLRVLQEKRFYPLGSEKEIKVDIRILAATNKDLELEVKAGRFREDLFYRIHVIPLYLPPLRERKEDIPLLVDHFMKKISNATKKDIKGVSNQAFKKLMSYDWPGNVRELENIIEYAAVMTPSDIISEDFILQTKTVEDEKIKPLKEAKNIFEKDYISKVLSLTGGNVSQASKLAGKYRADFYVLLKKHNLTAQDFKMLK